MTAREIVLGVEIVHGYIIERGDSRHFPLRVVVGETTEQFG